MENEQKELFGAWVQASGTILAAVGSTPFKHFTESQLTSFNLWGNVLQATGNSIMADSEEHYTLNKIGNQIQALGNVTVVAGIVLDLDEVTAQNLDIKGNLMQAAGGSAALSETLGEPPSTEIFYAFYGNILQVIGNSMQAIAGIIELSGGEGEKINTAGSWIQAAGSVIQAIGISKKLLDETGDKAEKFLFPKVM
ncbi:hypothetical protein M3204_03265 [Mesobacillus subterraneus]|jgi:hypothetical protein|uniref:DUF6944 family repetitive protein n=1 Tax=Mesobacillus subterraneus TaxID=285983 RepID=UPI00204057B8|nr:hypothetical protein [Mesobacillus subterraneus]MCM3663410.1 hypothetical protein [Mesobacillus subterraneus]MCM3683181.1 hypothetical protein [Mesobacillus subterraneus]